MNFYSCTNACALMQRSNENARIFAFCFSRQSFAKSMDIFVTSLVWSGAKKSGVLQRGGAPGQRLHPGAGVAHTVPPLHPLPAPPAQAGQKFEFWRIFPLWRIADFQLVPSPPQAQAGQKLEFWGISSLWRIADFSTHSRRLVNLPYPNIFGMVNLCHIKSMFLKIPVYNLLGHIKTKFFFSKSSFGKYLLRAPGQPFSRGFLTFNNTKF